MKGVILAGGLGTRLSPLTKVTNKHLLPVYDKPMIMYPIECLRNAGISDVLVVTGGKHAGAFVELLGNGKSVGLRKLNFAYQEGEGGIADALRLAEDFADGGKIAVVLGDNIIEGNIAASVDSFRKQEKGARILLKEVHDPHRFGVATMDKPGGSKVIKIVEKPKQPESNLAVVGIYMYDNQVFDIIRPLKVSERGELEITDVNNKYIEQGTMTAEVLKGWWTDAGTFESLYRATKLIVEGGANKMSM
ncbi:MAG TPA: sugar phosphate nucleotidyltransferase [Phycisphaerae bacterium]|nr:sugar phosphate nucleotidyltransferase [Phycisphaerae bacterium]